MVKFYLNLSIFAVFLKSKNIIFKIRRSKVTDYAALKTVADILMKLHPYVKHYLMTYYIQEL